MRSQEHHEQVALLVISGGHIVVLDPEDKAKVEKMSWAANVKRKKNGYATVYAQATDRSFGKKRLLQMHRVILGAKPGECVDHINGNALDNRKCNLRIANKAQNGANRAPNVCSKSGYKGVTKSASCSKWEASIRVNGIRKYLGLFATKEEAALAYNVAARVHFGEFARLNHV